MRCMSLLFLWYSPASFEILNDKKHVSIAYIVWKIITEQKKRIITYIKELIHQIVTVVT